MRPLLLLVLLTLNVLAQDAGLAALLPAGPHVLHERGQVLVQSPSQSRFEVTGVQDGVVSISVQGRELSFAQELLEDPAAAALDQVQALMAIAQREGVSGALKLRNTTLVGAHLSSGAAWVLPEGVAKKSAKAADETATDIAGPARRLADQLRHSELSPAAQQSVAQLLGMLSERASADSFLKPEFARALVRDGWLKALPKLDTAALKKSVTQALSLRPRTEYTGRGLRIVELQDEFGAGGWMIQTPLRAGFARVLPAPAFDPACPELILVVTLPVGSDPLADTDKAIAAEVHAGTTLLARWDAQGFHADAEQWRSIVAAHALRSTGIAKDFLPAHIPLVSLEGRMVRLITEHGSVPAPTAENTEAFLSAAAKALPGVGALDLLGERLFTYVLDSPDPRHPLLVGTDKVQGEIHQTAEQTLAACTGGICRGDCDDIAELYQAVALRQGKLAHIANLPGHAACFWVDALPDGRFAARVLQTGPPMSFTAGSVAEALRAAYTEFGIAENFDPDQIAIAVRFNGENQRSTWVLGWRIFADAKYAEAMIDVQRDWHFHTFRRGIVKMDAMIAAGDKDPANERELVGLHEATGQWKEAVEHIRRVLPAGDPGFALRLRLISSLYESGQKQQAEAQVSELLDTTLPAAARELGLGLSSIGFQLASTVLASGRDPALAARCLDSVCTPMVRDLQGRIGGFLRSRRFNEEAWKHDGSLAEMRRLLRTYVMLGCGILEESPELLATEHGGHIAETIEAWLGTIAFRDFDEPAELLDRYADAGRFAAIRLGAERFAKLLQSATPPDALPTQPWKREATAEQLAADVPFVRLAPQWHGQQLLNLFGTTRKTFDATVVRRLWTGMEAARAAARRLGFESRSMDHLMASCRVVAMAALKDRAGLRSALKAVAEQNDKRLRDQVVGWMGQSAHFFDAAWFREMLAAFDAELHFKPAYFEIAWKAVQCGAIPQALMAAELGAQRFADDPAFVEEAAWLKRLVQPEKP